MTKVPRYEDHQCALLGALVTCARQHRKIAYSDLVAATRVPLSMANPVHRNILSEWLFRIAREEHEGGRPMLPALVVRASTGLPGPGFFTMLEDLGRTRPGESEADAYERELAAIFRYHGNPRLQIPCWVCRKNACDSGIETRKREYDIALLPRRYELAGDPMFLVVHKSTHPDERVAGQFMTPEYWEANWAGYGELPERRFLLGTASPVWMVDQWSPDETGKRVQILLTRERKILDVRKLRDYPDGSGLIEVLYSDLEKRSTKVRRIHGAYNYPADERNCNREGWPEPAPEQVFAAMESRIPE